MTALLKDFKVSNPARITLVLSRSFCLGTRCSNHHRQFQPNRGDTNVLSCKLRARSSLLEDLCIIQLQAANENVYGSRYQWIILGYPSLSAWWHDQSDCSMQEMIRAINGTLQTRVPRLSMDKDQVSDYGIKRKEENNFFQNQSASLTDYLEIFPELERDYFDGYAYDTMWTIARLYQIPLAANESNVDRFRKAIDTIDFSGATVSTGNAKNQLCIVSTIDF